MSEDRFTGIPAEAFEFYEALAADPTKTFWEAHKAPAAELAALTDALAGAGMEIDGSRVATRPRGVRADHPNLEWLRYRTLYAARHWEPAAWMGKASAATKIRDQWRALTPLLDWFADVVGPGETSAGTGSQNGL